MSSPTWFPARDDGAPWRNGTTCVLAGDTALFVGGALRDENGPTVVVSTYHAPSQL